MKLKKQTLYKSVQKIRNVIRGLSTLLKKVRIVPILKVYTFLILNNSHYVGAGGKPKGLTPRE